MHNSPIQYCDPHTLSPLTNQVSGFLSSLEKGHSYPIVRGIPRFCDTSNYSHNFGFQWTTFDTTQLDNFSGSNLTEVRFYSETGWSSTDLSNSTVLEVGSGAGRFTEVFLRTTSATLYSVDYSCAVDSNSNNNRKYGDRLRLAQASIYELPFADNSFDKIFCLGVLQHTPSFEDSVSSLIRKARIGGEIVVDFYPIKGWHTKIHSKYLLRPLTKHLPNSLLLLLIRSNIRWMLALFDLLCFLRLGVLTRFIPITDVRGFPPTLSRAERREWAVMDTFDAFSPQYDHPQRVEAVARMFSTRGCEVSFAGDVHYQGGCSTVVRAFKRAV